MNNIKTIIFDYDGTLHDSMEIYGPAFRKAYAYLVEQGAVEDKELSREEVSQWLGYSAQEAWRLFMPNVLQEYKDAAGKIIGQEMMAAMKAGKAKLYPGAEKTLAELKERGYYLVLLSNCNGDYLEQHKEMFGLERYFDRLYCGEEFSFIPKHEIFRQIRNDLPAEYLIVGDRKHDFEIANVHQLTAIACRYGYGNKEEYSLATQGIQQVEDLLEILRK